MFYIPNDFSFSNTNYHKISEKVWSYLCTWNPIDSSCHGRICLSISRLGAYPDDWRTKPGSTDCMRTVPSCAPSAAVLPLPMWHQRNSHRAAADRTQTEDLTGGCSTWGRISGKTWREQEKPSQVEGTGAVGGIDRPEQTLVDGVEFCFLSGPHWNEPHFKYIAIICEKKPLHVYVRYDQKMLWQRNKVSTSTT